MELSNGFSSLNEVLESISYLCTQYKKRQTEQVAFCVLQHFRQGESTSGNKRHSAERNVHK
jgi:hypothetical protein